MNSTETATRSIALLTLTCLAAAGIYGARELALKGNDWLKGQDHLPTRVALRLMGMRHRV